jgi:hypothetical protein
MFDPCSSRRRRTRHCTGQVWLSGWRGVGISIAAKADQEAYEGTLAVGLRRRQCQAQAEALIATDNLGLI